MDFSTPLRITASHFCWSPNGKFCALATTARLEIRNGTSLKLLKSFNCSEYIQALEWSPDSLLLYTANFNCGIVEVWQSDNSDWKCRIDEGSTGVVKICWSPDSRHLLCTAQYNLRVTVWSLINKSVYYIKFPKEAQPSMEFSHDGEYLALAQRIDCKDILAIFETKSWTQLKSFEVDTRDLAGVSWCPDDSVLAVWDSSVEYRVCIYTVTGQCLHSYSAYQWSLGVKNIVWSPDAHFLAIGSYDNNIRLLGHVTWKLLLELPLESSVEKANCVVLNERLEDVTVHSDEDSVSFAVEATYDEVDCRPVQLCTTDCVSGGGVSAMLFSHDGRFLASRTDDKPAVVFIWDMRSLKQHTVLVQLEAVRDMQWGPRRACLALCSSGSRVYLWTPLGSMSVAVPVSSMRIAVVKWHCSGSKLSLIGRDQFSVCYLNEKNEETVSH